jgi:hypothetical protein
MDGVVVNLRHGKRSSKEKERQHGVCCFIFIYLMHERNMAVAISTGVLEVLLALLWRRTVPVLGVDVVGYSSISKRADGRHEVPTSVEVWRPDIGWLDADEVG